MTTDYGSSLWILKQDTMLQAEYAIMISSMIASEGEADPAERIQTTGVPTLILQIDSGRLTVHGAMILAPPGKPCNIVVQPLTDQCDVSSEINQLSYKKLAQTFKSIRIAAKSLYHLHGNWEAIAHAGRPWQPDELVRKYPSASIRDISKGKLWLVTQENGQTLLAKYFKSMQTEDAIKVQTFCSERNFAPETVS